MPINVVLLMDTIAIEVNMYMEAVDAPAEAKTEILGDRFPPLVPVSLAPS